MKYNCRYKLVKISLLSTSTDYILCPKQSRRIFVFQVILSSSTPTGKLVVLARQDVACVCSSLFNHVFFNTRRWELFHRWVRQREFDKSVSIDGTRAFYTWKYTLKSAVLMIFNIIFARNYHFASHQVFCFTSVVLSVCILVCAMLSRLPSMHQLQFVVVNTHVNNKCNDLIENCSPRNDTYKSWAFWSVLKFSRNVLF